MNIQLNKSERNKVDKYCQSYYISYNKRSPKLASLMSSQKEESHTKLSCISTKFKAIEIFGDYSAKLKSLLLILNSHVICGVTSSIYVNAIWSMINNQEVTISER